MAGRNRNKKKAGESGSGRPFGREFGKRFSRGGFGSHAGRGRGREHWGTGRRFQDHKGERMSRAERGERTREDILDAAAELFAKHGFEGVSMRDLAAAIKASQALLHFHFGRKRDLYDAVQGRLHEEYSEAVSDALDEESSTLDFFLGGLASRVRYTSVHPERARMMLWEQLEGDHEETAAARKIRETVFKRVERAKKEGLLREEIKTPMLASVLAGAVQIWPLLKERYGAMLPRGERRHADEWYIDEILRLMIYGAGTDEFRRLFEERYAVGGAEESEETNSSEGSK